MVWFKVDDTLAQSRKVLSIPRPHRAAAMGLWALAGAWSAGEEQDGHVPGYMVDELAGTDESAAWLVASGLWDEVDDGYRFRSWAEYQPTRADLDAKRDAERQRKAAWRARRAAGTDAKTADDVPELSRRDTAGTPTGVRESSALTRPDPTRPDPTPTSSSNELEVNSSSEAAEAAPRHDVERLLDLLDEGIVGNGGKAPSRNRKNRDAMRLLLDRDGRTPGQVEAAIRWCQADEFWRGNILSASKLREKYDQLRLAAQRTGRAAGASRAEERQRHNLSVVEQFAAAETTKGLTS